MEKLKNNFTTTEQSKRLLELGVPADSADCYLLRTHTKGDTFIVEVLHDELYSKKDKFTNLLEYLPCWSVGRLMEICKICEPKKYYEQLCEELQYSQNYCVVIISHIIANLLIIDFSKLDD